MICPNCIAKISDFDEKCPACGVDLNDYETEKIIDENNKSSTSITIVKRILIGILVIATIIMLCFGYNYNLDSFNNRSKKNRFIARYKPKTKSIES